MTLSLAWINTLFFVAIRVGTLFLLTPIQAIRDLPMPVRLLLTLAFSLILMPTLHSQSTDELDWLIGGVCEWANGLILATAVFLCFAIFQLAGHLIESEMGLNSLSAFNPSEQHQETVSSQWLSLLAVLFFFGIDGHVWLFKGLAFSFTLIPPGNISWFSGFSPLVKLFGLMFSMSFIMASPVLLAMLLMDWCAAVLTRNMPQVNPYFLVLPFKIILGLMLLALQTSVLKPLMQSAFLSLFQTWQEVLS